MVSVTNQSLKASSNFKVQLAVCAVFVTHLSLSLLVALLFCCCRTRHISKPMHLLSLFQCNNCFQVFDMMGYEPNMWNKMNIHIGGTYGHTPEDKQATLERFVV